MAVKHSTHTVCVPCDTSYRQSRNESDGLASILYLQWFQWFEQLIFALFLPSKVLVFVSIFYNMYKVIILFMVMPMLSKKLHQKCTTCFISDTC
jgi:hypothetical protein